MKIKSLSLSVLLFSIIIAVSCSKEKELPQVDSKDLDPTAEPYNYVNISSEMGKLGRVLFYDKSLSVNNAVSCGSCHKQALAFSDNKQFSTGFENKMTSRNTPPIQNLTSAFQILEDPAFTGQALFWDGRERSLKQMVMAPIVNHIEMGMRSQDDIVEKISEKEYYKEMFIQAYGDEIINFDRIAEALSGFTGSIQSQNSQFDLSFFTGDNSQFNALQIKGQELFFGKYNCGSCHNLFSQTGYSEPSGEELLNIGLDVDYADNGKGDLSGNAMDNGKFKIPNLRNIELTAPYMHDGRFSSLSEVIDHYSTGVKNHPNLDVRLKDEAGNPIVFNITEDEKAALIAFMQTLTDRQLISDPKFSDPFN